MMSLTVFMIALVCLFVVVSSADVSLDDDNEINNKKNVNYIKCESDRDCPEYDYCYEGKYCVECYDCDRYRRAKAIQRCARKLEDCGPCVTGYIQLTMGPNRVVCIPPVTQAQPQLAESPDNVLLNLKTSNAIGIGMVAFLAVAAFASWHCYRRKRSGAEVDGQWCDFELAQRGTRPNFSGTSLDPPAYEETQIRSVSENGSTASSFNLRVTGHPERKLKAVPFQLSFGEHTVALAPPAYNNSVEDVNNSGQENLADVPVDESEVDHPIASANSSNIAIEDEATQPSFWTPGPSYQTTETPTRTEAAAKDNEDRITPPSKRRKTNDF